MKQEVAYPSVMVNVDRTKADQAGLTQRDVANSVLISLSSSGQVAPNQWLNPVNGVNYQVAVQTPQYRIDSFDALQRTPLTAAAATAAPQLLSNFATLETHHHRRSGEPLQRAADFTTFSPTRICAIWAA